MDKVWAHIVEWFDGANGPFRQGFDKLEHAERHAATVGGKVLATVEDNDTSHEGETVTDTDANNGDAK